MLYCRGGDLYSFLVANESVLWGWWPSSIYHKISNEREKKRKTKVPQSAPCLVYETGDLSLARIFVISLESIVQDVSAPLDNSNGFRNVGQRTFSLVDDRCRCDLIQEKDK